MKKLLSEFKEFALKGNMLDLAVGVSVHFRRSQLHHHGICHLYDRQGHQ